MQTRPTLDHAVRSLTGGLTVPILAKVGGVVIAIGLVFDTAAHTVLHNIHDQLIGSFPLGEHFAHLVVVIGMVLVLAGIVADGINARRRDARREGSTRHAVR